DEVEGRDPRDGRRDCCGTRPSPPARAHDPTESGEVEDITGYARPEPPRPSATAQDAEAGRNLAGPESSEDPVVLLPVRGADPPSNAFGCQELGQAEAQAEPSETVGPSHERPRLRG